MRDDRLASARSLRLAVGVVAVALLSAAFAVGFRLALAGVLERALGRADIVSAMHASPTWVRVLLPAVGGLVAGGLGLAARRWPASHGVGDVMEAIVLGGVRLSLRVTVLKSIASWIAMGTGGSIGREGPLIQFGGATGQTLGERLGLSDADTRVLVAAGTAAGFAAAYNTPFAAVLFVLEVVTGIVVLDAILPCIVAVVVASVVSRALDGDGPLYGARAFQMGASIELVAFLGLGVVGALAAQGFMRLLTFGERLFARVPLPYRSALGGALAGLVVMVLPEVAGNGVAPLDALLDGHFTIAFVAVLLVGKMVATTASVSSGSPGGVFTPTLLVGGATGLLFAAALEALGGSAFGHLDPGSYALVGMAAATAASMHAPLLAAVMVFELSGDYAIVLPLLLATAIATLVSRGLRAQSLYAAELERRGVSWELTMAGREVRRDAP